jgi:putative membrane-bound dehydrogenase-like protein
MNRLILSAVMLGAAPAARASGAPAADGDYRAGAAKVDITPVAFPVRVNGGFLEKTAAQAHDRLHARALVIANGHERVAICVVDTCMLPRELIDTAKAAAAKATGIPAGRMLVSATHTHSAPAAMGCLGARIDPAYAGFLPGKIAEAIAAAAARERPARIGRGAVDAWDLTNCRRWIRRPDRLLTDPFGEVSVRANMHPGYESPDVTGPAGPIDPQLSLLSVQATDGKPIAVLGNFSMHYFGAPALSADFCGRFAEGIGRLVGAKEGDDFVGILSQGTSGDSHWMDYSRPQAKVTLDDYSARLLARAAEAHRAIEHRGAGPLAMAETTLTLRRRLAGAARLDWARTLAGPMGDRPAANQREVYAREQLFLAAEPERELKLQALRVGDTGITAIPNEVYALTGLKLKARSPLPATFNIELANGAEGYIPPPEQHFLGGYTTWAARTAGLEERAEPKIVETLLGLLERVAGTARREIAPSHGPYARAVLADRPHAYWRLEESDFPAAADASGAGRDARFEPGVALHLPGAQSAADAISAVPENPSAFSGPRVNRAPHFAGGRLRAELPELGRDYAVEFWLWNALPADARPVNGVLWSRGPAGDAAAGEHLAIGGASADGPPGRLFFHTGDGRAGTLQGKTALGFRRWHHVALVRSGDRVRVHLDGHAEPEIDTTAAATALKPAKEVFLAGRCDGFAPFEGRLDEVAVHDRALTAAEIAAHFAASGRSAPASAVTLAPAPDVAPLSPEESRRKFHVAPGFRVELAAAEPLVADPVAFDWDSRGRLWVVEMADYPLGLDGKGAPGGRVRVLEDTDGDGRYDRSTLFAEGLSFPNGILTWRDGVIVTAAPHILFLRDTDGDGKADSREVLVSGLFEGNQQLRANGLRWGLDNRVHVASGGHHRGHGAATKLKSHRNGAEVATGSRDFRFRPDTGELEPQSGPTQYGRNRDNWGRWFGTQNSNPLWHYVLPDHYLARNPAFAAEQTLVQLLTPANPPVFPASAPEKRYHSFHQAGRFTSACSAVLARDARTFGAADGVLDALVCEPFHNLVQHARLTDRGVSFTAERRPGESGLDFLSSEDRWCRPVMVREGPDGALWVADMYRYIIEHPQFLPQRGKDELMAHYRLGDDRGRIYRVSREGLPPFRAPRLDRLDAAGLVAALRSPGGWERDQAHQLLLWRSDPAAIAPLRALAAGAAEPLARLHALCVLDGLGRLTPEEVIRALADPHPGVRENALRLAETRFNPALLSAAAGLAADPEPKVRLQLAFSLGASTDPLAGATLGRLIAGDAADPMILAAVLSSAAHHGAAVTAAAARAGPGVLGRAAGALLPAALAAGDRGSVALLLEAIVGGDGPMSPESTDLLRRFLVLLSERGTSLALVRAAQPLDRLSGAAARATERMNESRRRAADSSIRPGDRIAAAALLAADAPNRPEALASLAGWLDARHPPAVQAAAARALAATAAAEIPTLFAAAWSRTGPAGRDATLAGWLGRGPWAVDLLERVERGEIPPAAFDTTQRARLLRHESREVQRLAQKTFGGAMPTRVAVIERYVPALALGGDAARGRELYRAACAACHRRGEEGRDVGPDLASVISHTPERLLSSILDPNADIQPGYAAFTCTLQDGEQVYGLIASETAGSVTLKLLDGSRRTFRRNEIASLEGGASSLMPEGLESAIPPQGMADLIAFLRGPLR